MGKKTDRGRSNIDIPARPYFGPKQPKKGGIITKTLNEMRVEAGLDPAGAGEDSTVAIPLLNHDSDFIFVDSEPIDIESFRRAWESYNVGIIEGMSPIAIAAEEVEKELSKINIPHGKNLYSRKLRIRR